MSSRLGYVPMLFNPAQKSQYLADSASGDPLVRFYVEDGNRRMEPWEPDFDSARAMLRAGILGPNVEQTIRSFDSGEAPWPHNYLFKPDELASMLSACGVADLRLSGPGAMSRSIPNAILKKLLTSEACREPFLDLCYEFDSNPYVCGLGKDNLVASGLLNAV